MIISDFFKISDLKHSGEEDADIDSESSKNGDSCLRRYPVVL